MDFIQILKEQKIEGKGVEKELTRAIQTNKRLVREVAEKERVIMMYGVKWDINPIRSKMEREEMNTVKNTEK